MQISGVRFRVEADFPGEGARVYWLEVAPGACAPQVFPNGYSARQARLSADRDCRASAYFTCT